MPDNTLSHGIQYPVPGDLIKKSGETSELANVFRAMARSTDNAMGVLTEAVDSSLKFRSPSELTGDTSSWVGLERAGMYRLPTQSFVDDIQGRPAGAGPGIVTILPIGSGGSKLWWMEYQGSRKWERSVSSTPGNTTPWARTDPATRTVIHQLTQPGPPSRVDTEPQRHVRIPLRVSTEIHSWGATFRNYNDRSGTSFGDVTMLAVFVGKRERLSDGTYTANFSEVPTSLGVPVEGGSASSRRWFVDGAGVTLEPNTEYLLSYAYTGTGNNHLGIGGSYNGINPAGVGSTSPVSNTWSPDTPLDVYLRLDAPAGTPTIGYVGSSSETGLKSKYPLRDMWAWKHAESLGALPVFVAHSGGTMESIATGFQWTKTDAFAPVDRVYLCAGSNDVYLGSTLATLKDRHAALVAVIKRNFGKTVVNTTVFPRAVEAAGVGTVRRQYNDWLATMPSGTVSTFDRAGAVSGGSGLLRPDFDSGDQTHLTEGGHTAIADAVARGAGGGVGDRGSDPQILTHDGKYYIN